MKNFTYLCLAFVLFITDALNAQSIQRVRVDFQTPLGYTRQLLLGFTPDNSATDGFDYGYDALNGDNFPDDFSWIIEDERYIIQGVGEFDETKKYPVGLFLTNSGSINVTLNSTENFSSMIDVYIYDALLDVYTKINQNILNLNISAGNHEDRFYVAFSNPQSGETLSTNDYQNFPFDMKYIRNSQELVFRSSEFAQIEKIEIYNITGKKILQLNHFSNALISSKLPNNYTGITLVKVTTFNGNFLKKILLH